jgi:hypothetical protein
MGTLGKFTIRKPRADSWEYIVEIEQVGGATIRLRAGVEDLDRMSATIDEQLDAMVEAAERLGAET